MKLLVTANENEMIPATVTGTSKTCASRFSTPKSTMAPMAPTNMNLRKRRASLRLRLAKVIIRDIFPLNADRCGELGVSINHHQQSQQRTDHQMGIVDV